MNAAAKVTGDEDTEALSLLRALGYQIDDIQAIAQDQRAFARRSPPRTRDVALGVRLEAGSLELGGGCFTNAYTLRLALGAVRVRAESAADGFALRDQCASGDALAAVSGSFCFISDDPRYQPAEPRLDFCCRKGEIVSLPTVTKPAFLMYRGQPSVRTLRAEGTLLIDDRPFAWSGSKSHQQMQGSGTRTALVFGAANCRVRYADNERTGFLRYVRRSDNHTPPDRGSVDCVVTRSPKRGLLIHSLHPGGGADLFTGSCVLRLPAREARAVCVGAPVRVTGIDGLSAEDITSGMSVGPSVADAVGGRLTGYDESLGVSPFRAVRYARTLLWISGDTLCFRVYDGAPLTDTFQGITPAEVARECDAERLDASDVYYLDGGQSSKIALRHGNAVEVVGNLHYLEWPRGSQTVFRWRGLEGRPLNSWFTISRRDGAQDFGPRF